MRLTGWLAVAGLLACNAVAAASFSFAVFGDTPYSTDEELRMAEMLREIDREDIEFVVHIGDFKNGWTSCGDPVFAQRRQMLGASRHPLIYLPGDNEWTDCWRLLAGAYDPLERLARLREIFFSTDSSLGSRPMALTRQVDAAGADAYPEHVRWTRGKVVFAGFNLPGGDNNLRRMPEEHARRDAAAREWLKQAFALARGQGADAVVVLIHANPFSLLNRARRGYGDFIDLLASETHGFAGQVLLVHGDTHFHRIDQPLRIPGSDETLRNFTRLEVYGSPRVDWVRVRAWEDDSGTRFEISPGRERQ